MMHIDLSHRAIRHALRQLFQAALEAVHPERVVERTLERHGSRLSIHGHSFDLRSFDRVMVVGAGKASLGMARAVERMLGHTLRGGIVVTTEGEPGLHQTSLTIRTAGHPLPDQRGAKAAQDILRLIGALTPTDLLLVLLSGGASSLLPAPAPGLTLRDKRITTTLLLRCGATIQEINAVRKHLSAIKGGRLAAATSATILTLILSDVPGDDLGTIGSGPTAPDPTTYEEACSVLRQHGIWTAVPRSVRRHLQWGLDGRIPETPKPGSPIFRRVHHVVLGNTATAIMAMERFARTMGYHPLVLTTQLQGEARVIGTFLGNIAKEIDRTGHPIRRPACIMLGGEPTVTIAPSSRRHGRVAGKGGRAQELVLAGGLELAGCPNLWLAGLGTDGRDGPTDVAGAAADGRLAHKARLRGLDPESLLAHHNSYALFQGAGGHIRTGPTGTNVNDVYLIVAP